MALNTNFSPGDQQSNILAKLLILFGGSPKNGDGTSQLLQKILQAAANASGGTSPVTQADLTALEAEIPTLFDDSSTGTNADAVISQRFSGTEIEAARFNSGTGYLELYCATNSVNKRIQLSNDKSALSFLGATGKSKGAFIDVVGQDYTSGAGNVNITTSNRSDAAKGNFKVLNQAANSASSTTRLEIFWNGDARLAPVWADNLNVFTGLKLDVTDTTSDHASLVLDCQVGSASVFAVGKHGNTIQKVASLTPAGSVEIDFDLAYNRTITLDQATTFTTVNLGAGKEVCVKVLCDGTGRNLTFPADWKFVGTKPTSIAASKTGILSLKAYSAADTGVVAAWGVEA
jgi:hypothetical protein